MDRVLEHTQTNSPELFAYVDASWGGDKDTRRSRYGHGIYFGRALISWRSKLHACICLSTAESEYVGATEATKEVMWIRFLLNDVGLAPKSATVLKEDNKACIQWHLTTVSGRNKHLELKMHYVRERISAGDIKLDYIDTKKQRADIFTKILARPAFEKNRELLLNPPTLN